MSKSSEKGRFQSKFIDDVIEIAAVTGALGVGAGKTDKDIMWTASIELIAWKSLNSNEPVKIEEVRLKWLVDDEEWKKSKDILEKNIVVRLQVRISGKSMMLVKILDTEYRDDDLEAILQDSMKPVFYKDELLGEFELDKSVKLFSKRISWANEEGNLYFDWHEVKNIMESSLKTAYTLFKDQNEWNNKVRIYASEELVDLANDWLQDNDEAEIDEITKEMFIDFMKLDSISVSPDGDFEIYFFDGDMFWGHTIIVSGNVNGDFYSAEIAG
jgi:hypothetical protein